ncbi:queuosine precursor transporter [Hoeflea prorocentri]|uniref:Probable queuosine precursor transporter n=1 Tax=Hoeflea prorocentri TaxID=1922333 RepID=A0A9X3UQU9_9HYPH|nr:queuosine precursor transporter [Hoeflea prorocentri]MCY6383541.1 queuosine precursor transporter [Hoeflea prorocentri]MDA5401341.1 queuosine precursor transporter [Hoeflea prorocentri]
MLKDSAYSAFGLITRIYPYLLAMTAVVIASNYLVQFPVMYTIGPFVLDDILTWGAFTYPIAFLVTDLSNRHFGPAKARLIVTVGFVLAVGISIYVATPRIAIASGSAFLVAQLLDVSIFERLRHSRWWHAPLVSSVLGSIIDTVLFFSLAFAASFAILGANDAFAIEAAPLLGFFAFETPRWMSWAIGDLAVKLLVSLAMLAPYRAFLTVLRLHKPTGQHS